MAAAVAMMADQTLESRVARVESDVAYVRSDIAEMKADFREMRTEMRALDKKIADLERQLMRGLASNRIWMLLQSAAVLGVMARGFKWL
ncbi:MAG: hypothetical protein KGO22_07425 [Gammaproteobacteria bacterium]|nr:hypothetical protein [Gammaproteobacteria bacterium]